MNMEFDETLKKFGYPKNLIKSYDNWYLLLRPEQLTLGSLILFSKKKVSRYSDLDEKSFTEKHQIIVEIENILYNSFFCKKINYLMLMMVDPFVHFHIIPRYDSPIEFMQIRFQDPGWPALPDFTFNNIIPESKWSLFLKQVSKEFQVTSKPNN